MSSPEHKKKVWNLIKDIKVGMLSTSDGKSLRARPMHIVQEEYDGTLWFFTDTQADKTDEIKDDQHVGITFSDSDEGLYVSLSGLATLTREQSLIEKFWNPFIAAWFPEGKESPNVALIEIKVEAGEHWDADNSRLLELFKIAKANLTAEKPDMGQNEKFGQVSQ